MIDTEPVLKTLAKRFLLSLPFFAISVLMFILGSPFSIFAVFPLIVPAFILVGPLSTVISSPVGGIFNPGKRSKESSLLFSFPEARIMHGEYPEALELFYDMILMAPSNLEIYLRVIDLSLRHLNDPDVARSAFHLGLKNMKSLEKRKYLAEEYRRLTRLFRQV